MICKYIFIFFLICTSIKIDAKIRECTLLEKIENSKIIALVELIETTDSFIIKGEDFRTPQYQIPRFAHYKIVDVLKGKIKNDYIVVDYKKTNDKYKPFICRPMVSPIECETVILFLESEELIFEGFQGKESLISSNIKNYTNCLKKIIQASLSKSKQERDVALIKLYNTKNQFQRNMIKNLIVESWELINPKFGPILKSFLENNISDSNLGYRAVRKLGQIHDKSYLSVFSKTLYDFDPTIRHASIEALGEYKNNEALMILELYVKKAKWGEEISFANSIMLKIKNELKL